LIKQSGLKGVSYEQYKKKIEIYFCWGCQIFVMMLMLTCLTYFSLSL